MIKAIETQDVGEAMYLGNHDYEVDMEPIKLANGTEIWDKKAVIRKDTGKYLGTVGKDYQPVQPKTIYSMVDAMLKSTGGKITSVIDLHNGSVFGVALTLSQAEFLPGDRVDHQFLILASHNGMYGILGRALTTRLLCLNQVPSSTRLFNLKHTRFVTDRLDVATRMLTYYDKEIKNFDSSMKQLVDLKMTDNRMTEFVHELYPKAAGAPSKRSQSIRTNNMTALIDLLYHGKGLDVPGLKGTGWHVFNALTEYVNYERTTRVQEGREENEVRFEAINFGSGNELMQRGLTLLLDMANKNEPYPDFVKAAF
jgi:phage/plasmid-like protein (TIGR03299 family)